jgi:poly-gamma-glutamate capsule biosynthesis protein CapA/YwtB (metallophosphatase superfamily)
MPLTRRQFAAALPVTGLALAGGLSLPVRPAPGAPSEPEDDPGPTFTFLMAGDVMFDDLPGETIAKGGDPFREFADVLHGADYVIGNLECAVCLKGEKVPKKYNHRGHPRVIPLLAKYFHAMSLANNHTGDFGTEGLVDTVERLEAAGVGYFGGGRNVEEAHRPLIVEKNGVRLALLGYDEFKPQSFEAGPDRPGVAWSLGDAHEARVMADLRDAREKHKADVVIPYMHWGWEHEPHNVRP